MDILWNCITKRRLIPSFVFISYLCGLLVLTRWFELCATRNVLPEIVKWKFYLTLCFMWEWFLWRMRFVATNDAWCFGLRCGFYASNSFFFHLFIKHPFGFSTRRIHVRNVVCFNFVSEIRFTSHFICEKKILFIRHFNAYQIKFNIDYHFELKDLPKIEMKMTLWWKLRKILPYFIYDVGKLMKWLILSCDARVVNEPKIKSNLMDSKNGRLNFHFGNEFEPFE